MSEKRSRYLTTKNNNDIHKLAMHHGNYIMTESNLLDDLDESYSSQ